MADIVNTTRMEWVSGQKGFVRGKGSEQKHLFKGEESSLDNYEFIMSRSCVDTRFSPRHRHNFDQFRFALEGPCNHSPEEDIPEGQLGFFPEGVYYGPQSIRNGSRFLSLQFGGASGGGFLSYAGWTRGYGELLKRGTFEKGVYTFVDSAGQRHNKDAWLAVAEYLKNGPVIFPKGRMDRPVTMDPSAYVWVPVKKQPGVAIKHLGTFNERGTFAAVVQVAAGASYRFESEAQTLLLYVLAGKGTMDSEALEKEYAARINKNGPASVVTAQTEINILVFGMPRFD